jgi:hypothetical protein
MKRSIKIASGVFISFLISLFLVSPANADDVRFNGDHACPALYPIKQMVIDVAANTTTTVCITQYQWDIEMMGGDTHSKWLSSGGTYDATRDIANWKAERSAIEQLRTDTEALAKAEAIKYPNTQVCKAYSYTSTYNGSGGGSFCTIHTETIDVSVRPITPPVGDTTTLMSTNSVASSAVFATVDVPAATSVTAKYFASTTKAVKKLKKMSYTFAKGPKGTEVKVAKTAGDSCFVAGRTVYLGSKSECSVAVTVTKKGVVQGVKTLTFVR